MKSLHNKKSVRRFSYCSWFVFFSCSGDQHCSLWFFQRQGAEFCLAFVSGMWSWWGCIDVFAVSCVSACLSTKHITYANMGGLLHMSFLEEVALSLVAPCSFCLCLFLNDIQKQLFQGFLLIQGPPVSRLCLSYLVVSLFATSLCFLTRLHSIWRCKHVKGMKLCADFCSILSHPTIHKNVRPIPEDLRNV